MKYIFNYFSDEIANSEINYLIKDDIKDYINQRGCRPDNYETQILKIKDSGNTYKEIGRLFFLLGVISKSVICCRISPKQKSLVVDLIILLSSKTSEWEITVPRD